MRRDLWIRAGMAALRRQVPAATAAEIDQVIQQQLKAAMDAKSADALRSFLAYFDGQPGGRGGPARIDPAADRRQARLGGRDAALAGPAVVRPRGGRFRRRPVGGAVRRDRAPRERGRLLPGTPAGNSPMSCAATARPANNWSRRFPRTDRLARCSNRRRPGRRARWKSSPKSPM